ncbi:flavin reductase (DIM6/NTAB) family NADH-FMN oxidoreductase RutF [Rhodococcus sp. LBL1]|nr:flavin reductase (DIM6/NTAB) family NADH-FMN oxidoreductase RutF [Rhodococcus sp. LBL1]MDH6683899.1 flavin reductase (DIM6/NTAB) family NADH-FMN oxidoreductase RutF [Rhodococcus sp. LBL2]
MTTAAPTTHLGDDFRRAFRGHPAGVTIITAHTRSGPVGLTSSSVSSVSADPPILCFSVQSLRGSAAAIADAPSLLVHLLTAENVALARRFAAPGSAGRFGPSTPWSPLPTGEPFLHGTGPVLRCSPLTTVAAGPALVVTAAVDAVLPAESLAAPLVYQDRRYHCVSPWTALDS